MTLLEILHEIHSLYNGDTDYPTSTEDDYIINVNLANHACRVWGSEPYNWRELYVSGSITTVADQNEYSLPANFSKINSRVLVDGNELIYIKPEDKQSVLKLSSSSEFYTIYGKPGSKTLYINPSVEVGKTIEFDYYRKFEPLVNPTDVPDMSDPLYIIFFVMSKLYEQDARNDMLGDYRNQAVDSLNNMVIENETNPVSDVDRLY